MCLQWIVLNIPASVGTFRSAWYHDASRRVPSYLYWFSVRLLHRPDEWRSTRWLRNESSFKGWRSFLVDSTIAYIESLRQTCDLFLSEQLVGGALRNVTLDSFPISADQREAFENGCHYLQNPDTLPPLAIIGRAGTGKSFLASLLVDKATSLEIPILIVAPTGFQSESLSAQWGNNEKVSVGTFDSKLRYAQYNADEDVSVHNVVCYGLIFVDEFCYLGTMRFDLLMKTWTVGKQFCKLMLETSRNWMRQTCLAVVSTTEHGWMLLLSLRN